MDRLVINYIPCTAAVGLSLREAHNKDIDILFPGVLFFLSIQNTVLYTVYVTKGHKVESVLKLRLISVEEEWDIPGFFCMTFCLPQDDVGEYRGRQGSGYNIQ